MTRKSDISQNLKHKAVFDILEHEGMVVVSLKADLHVRFLCTIIACDFCCSHCLNHIQLLSFNLDFGYDMSQGFKTCFKILQHFL